MTYPRSPPLSVAPMMDRTDRHFRYLLRLITRRTLLYTEMVTTQAILRGASDRLLAYDPVEHPISLQLGGDDAAALVACARRAEDLGFDEVNLNCGCPSDRVQSGRFGVILMKQPEVVADAVAALQAAVRIPVTVKHRIGVDDLDRYEDMLAFVDTVRKAGADRFTVHARKAWLKGLSPKENRTVPPLRPEEVHRLKAERPDLQIELNGGIQSLDQAMRHLQAHPAGQPNGASPTTDSWGPSPSSEPSPHAPPVDAVMIGRAAYDDPFILADADHLLFGEAPSEIDRVSVVRAMIPYLERQVRGPDRCRPYAVVRHMLGLFAGQRGGRAYRRVLSTEGPRSCSGAEVLENALAEVVSQGGVRTTKPASINSESAKVASYRS